MSTNIFFRQKTRKITRNTYSKSRCWAGRSRNSSKRNPILQSSTRRSPTATKYLYHLQKKPKRNCKSSRKSILPCMIHFAQYLFRLRRNDSLKKQLQEALQRVNEAEAKEKEASLKEKDALRREKEATDRLASAVQGITLTRFVPAYLPFVCR